MDSNTAALIDLSLALPRSYRPSVLKPNQRVRMAFTESGRPIRFSARVAWASFEPAMTGSGYRAGIEFFDLEANAIQRFCDAKKKS